MCARTRACTCMNESVCVCVCDFGVRNYAHTNGVLQEPPQHLLTLGRPLEKELHGGREKLQLDR